MAVREILKMGDERLLRVARPVVPEEFGAAAMAALLRDMDDTMRAASGAGLAAPQIGVDLQVIVFGSDKVNPRYPDAPPVPHTVLLNPGYEPLSTEEAEDWEGCLSVPGLRGRVPRLRRIRYWGSAPDGSRVERVADDFHARVFQHEYDHLLGVLYPMRMRDLTQFGFIEVLFPGLGAAAEDD